MFRDSNGFIKGMVTGVIVGAAVSYMGNMNGSTKRMMRRNTGRAMRMVGSFMSNIGK